MTLSHAKKPTIQSYVTEEEKKVFLKTSFKKAKKLLQVFDRTLAELI